jgi:hypothetical protein
MRKKEFVAAQKKAFLEAMARTFGNVTQAAKATGIHRTTPYKWQVADPSFAKDFTSGMYKEMLLDAIDAKLVKLAIQDENPTALIFLAKTRGKKRGYVERTEHDFRGSILATVDYTRLSEATKQELETLAKDPGQSYQ